MSNLSLREIAQSQLDSTPVIDGQLIVCLDTGNAYRDTATAHVKIGSDLEVVSDLPLAPLAEKIYYLKPDKLYVFLGGNWTLLNDKTIDLDEAIAKLPAESSTTLNDDVEIITQDTDITQPHYYRRKLVVLWKYIKTKAQDFFAAKTHQHGKADITDFPTSMPASDVYPWAKAATKPSYTKAEVGLGKVDNTADADKTVKRATTSGTADSANSVAWKNVRDKPTTFPVEAHNHDDRYYTEAEIDGKLEKKSSTDHTHDLSELISALSIDSSTTLNDSVQIITQDTDTANQKYYRRPLTVLWNYIKSKADSVYSAIGHNHKIQNLEDYTTRVYDATIVRPADTVLASPQDKDGIATFRKLDKNDVGLENVDNTADKNKNVATAGIATTGVRDYNNANNIIKIGWSGTELDADSLTYVAGYTSDKKIHPASKDGVRSWLGLGDSAYKNTKSRSSKGSTDWTNNATDDAIVPTMSFMAYWDGAYNSNGASNLSYCDRGRFGTIVTKNTGDYAVAVHTHDLSAMINKLSTSTSTPVDSDYYVSQYVGGGTSTTTYHRRPMSALWNYIKGKANSVYLPLGGGTMTGRIIRSGGGSWISDRDNVAVFGNSHGQQAGYSYNPVVGQKTSSGAWTIGNLSGNESLIFNYTTDSNYNKGSNNNTGVYLPAQAGTIITSATIGSQSVNYANSAGAVAWGNVSGKPSSYPPSSHSHAYLPLGGGTISGALNFANGTWNLVGDDAYMGDHNIGGSFCIMGANDTTRLALVNKDNQGDYALVEYGGGNLNFNKKLGANITGHADGDLALSGGTMSNGATITFADSGTWSAGNGTYPRDCGGLSWTGQSDGVHLYAEETGGDNLELVMQFGDDNSNGLSIRNNVGGQTSRIDASGNATFNSSVTANTYYAPNWFRATGDSGFYFENHGGGWYMIDDTWIRAYNNKNIYTPGVIQCDSGFNGNLNGHASRDLALSGGTMTGNINFAGIGDNASSAGITWDGSTDGAGIYYQTTGSDQGNLVLNLMDDNNCYLRIAQNGNFRSYFSPSDGNFHGNVNGNCYGYADYLYNEGVGNMRFHWSGQNGQPTWLWGSNDGSNAYVWNPSNFSVNYANSAGNGVVASGSNYVRFGDGTQIYWCTNLSSGSILFYVPFIDTNYAIVCFGGDLGGILDPFYTDKQTTGVRLENVKDVVCIGRWK